MKYIESGGGDVVINNLGKNIHFIPVLKMAHLNRR